MKKQFTKLEIIKNKGCYSNGQVESLSFINNETILLTDIIKSEIPIKDKRWFIWNKSEMDLNQKKQLALKLAWLVLPIFENKYPEDKRVRECLEYTELFYKGEITIDELIIKKRAAAAAVDAADAAYAAAAAAAVDAADAAYAAAAYAAVDAAVDAAAERISYSKQIELLLIEFIENN